MKINHISAIVLTSGVTMLLVHQFVVKIIASKIDDALVQYNTLDALVGVFALSLGLIAIGVVTAVAGVAKNRLTH